MTHEFSQEERKKIIFQFAESLNFSSDEYLIKVMKNVSADYARGYLDAFLANAREEIFYYSISS